MKKKDIYEKEAQEVLKESKDKLWETVLETQENNYDEAERKIIYEIEKKKISDNIPKILDTPTKNSSTSKIKNVPNEYSAISKVALDKIIESENISVKEIIHYASNHISECTNLSDGKNSKHGNVANFRKKVLKI